MPDKSPAVRLGKTIGYAFSDLSLAVQALTHSSRAYEMAEENGAHNEVLEFLGDSVIGLLAAEYLRGHYPDSREGELSKLRSMATSTESLSEYARKIKLDRLLLLGKGEEKSGGRKKKTILAGAFEAVVGALYTDGSLPAARLLLQPLLEETFRKIKTGSFLINDYKSALQEYVQKQGWPMPRYAVVESKGPDHKKTFVIEVSCGGRVMARAKGDSKKDAEQRAAQKALKGKLGRRLKDLPCEMFVVKKD